MCETAPAKSYFVLLTPVSCLLFFSLYNSMLWTLRVLLAAAAGISAARAFCPTSEWTPYESTCYWASDYELAWEDALLVCPTLFHGAVMASVHDLEQNAFLAETIMQDDRAWIGLRCADGTAASCRWADGSAYDFHNWYGSQDPVHCSGECCAELNYSLYDGEWWGGNCTVVYI